MKKVLILQNIVPHYRKALYNKLSEKYDVTVLHSGKPSINESDIYKEKITSLKTIMKFKIQGGVIDEVKNGEYHAIVAMLDIQWINNIIASIIFPKNTKFIWWGIMVSENKLGNIIRAFILKRGLPAIFYTKQGIIDMEKYGAKSENFTYCNNTIHIENRIKCYESKEKNSILFVGSLDTRKKIDTLISSFHSIIDKIPDFVNIDIIGDGTEAENILFQIQSLNLNDRVKMHGKITDTNELGEFYKKAICSVSYGQAGLAVLQSFGYGVPFLTKENAISGGEITNIEHGINGFICNNNEESLARFLEQICNDFDLSREMGEKAFEYYSKHCTIENMAFKFSKCIDK